MFLKYYVHAGVYFQFSLYRCINASLLFFCAFSCIYQKTTEIKELIDQCTWTWTTQEEVNGYKVVGPNGNSIFLPVTGYGYTTYHMQSKNEARYWSSSLQAVDMTTHGQGVYFKAGDISWGSYYRYLGCAVRPVCK